jgi:thiol-disulfide isomerase/thioredoxin
MNRKLLRIVAAGTTLLLGAASVRAGDDDLRLVPEFTATQAADWINSPPLKLGALEGRVLLIDFWTFDCVNCVRSIPWLKALGSRWSRLGLTIVGVHTPEFEHERIPANVAARTKALGVDWPVMLDADRAYWLAIGNRFWPAFYLVDKRGLIRAVLAGETHEGDANAKQVEALVAELIAEPG